MAVLCLRGTLNSCWMRAVSGGQWRRLSLALSLAFSGGQSPICDVCSDLPRTYYHADVSGGPKECSLERTGTACNLLVLDEVMQHLDSEGCMRVGKLLEDLISQQLTCFTTVLVILQTSVGEELGDAFDEVDVIVKRNDCSVVQSISGRMY